MILFKRLEVRLLGYLDTKTQAGQRCGNKMLNTPYEILREKSRES
jgi:hypothetical protein